MRLSCCCQTMCELRLDSAACSASRCVTRCEKPSHSATPEAAHFSQILLSVLEGSSGRLTNQQRRGRLGGWIPGRLLWPCCAAPRIATVWHSLHCWGKYKSVQTIADASGLGMAHVKTVPPPLDNPRDPSGSSAPNLARTMRRHGPEAVVAYQTVPCESM